MDKSKNIILFDGVCNLCNSSITFIIKRENGDVFRYAALQSNIGKKLTDRYDIDTSKVDSIILIKNEEAYVKSSAALRIARHLSGGYSLLYGLIVLPRFMRDWLYDIIANNRYKWFGKKESCMIPTPELKAKFLHD